MNQIAIYLLYKMDQFKMFAYFVGEKHKAPATIVHVRRIISMSTSLDIVQYVLLKVPTS